MSEIVRVPFHGEDVAAIEVNGKPHVLFRPVVESMGLAYSSQLQRLRSRSWASSIVTSNTVAADGKTRQMVAVDIRTLTMWLATIDEHRVDGSVRPLLIAYQCEIADVIERHFMRLHGNTEDPAAFTWTLDETCAILRQRYHLHHSPISLGKLFRTAGIWKQNGAPTVAFAELFHFTGSAWTVLPIGMPKIAKQLLKVTHQLQQSYAIQMRLQLEGVGGDIQIVGETGPEVLKLPIDGTIIPPHETA